MKLETIMARKTTKQWEDLKGLYTNCLCFSKERGLYMATIPEDSNTPTELLYRPHGYAGYALNKVSIPERNVEITILSNFGYGSRSYLSAAICFGDRRLLDFDKSKINVLNNCSVSTIDVPVYEWNLLFEKIIEAYNAKDCQSSAAALVYVNKLSDMLDTDKILVKGCFDKESPTHWEGDFLISLYTGEKIQDLLRGLDLGKVANSDVLKSALDLCRMYIAKLKEQTLDYGDSRTAQLSKSLCAIHHFMCEHDSGAEYLSMILDKEI